MKATINVFGYTQTQSEINEKRGEMKSPTAAAAAETADGNNGTGSDASKSIIGVNNSFNNSDDPLQHITRPSCVHTNTDNYTIATTSTNTTITNDNNNVKMKNGKASKKWDIMSLPDDVLYVIFNYLKPADLCEISKVCRRFNFLSCKDCVWNQHADNIVLTDFPLDRRKRNIYSCKEKCRLAPNWKNGTFKDRFVTKNKFRQIPWIQRHKQDIWFSSGNIIRCFTSPGKSGHLKENRNRFLKGMEHDITRFVVKNNMTVASSLDGSVHGWNLSGESLFHHKKVHQSYIHCVDCTDNCYITGSKDGYCKVTPLQLQDNNKKGSDSLISRRFKAGERIWCLQSSPCQRFFVAGLAGCLDSPPLVMWDIESGDFLGHLKCNSKHGAGVLHLKFESVNELLTCGYDTFVRLWDLRTRSCVSQWEEPYDSSLYCLETDGGNALAVGTARHGMVRMWDKRKTEPVQMYYSTSCNSPVYSLAMDCGHLYLALDMGLSVMDFTG